MRQFSPNNPCKTILAPNSTICRARKIDLPGFFRYAENREKEGVLWNSDNDQEDPAGFRSAPETRYDDEAEWALYRIPFEEGEYRFLLVFG